VPWVASTSTGTSVRWPASSCSGSCSNRSLSRFASWDKDLFEQLPEQLLAGHLTGVPVLVLATQGTDRGLLDHAIASLANAGARVTGTWVLTARWSLDDHDEISDLDDVLGTQEQNVGRLRRAAVAQVSSLLQAATAPPAAGAAPADIEPDLLAKLVDAGFVTYQPQPGADDQRVLLPAAGARYLVVSSSKPNAGAQTAASALLQTLAAGQVMPVVAAQGLVELPDTAKGPASEDNRRTSFVGPLRRADGTKAHLATVDDLDSAAGLAAVVLALEDLGRGEVGHYGVGPGAARLLPAPPPTP